MIPKNRPVMGKDLEAVAQQFGMLTSDACWIFGLSITRWTQIVRQAADTPLSDPTLALLVRFLGEHSELSVLPRFPTAQEMYDEVNAVMEIDQKRFAVMFGNEETATYRWLKPGSRMSPAANRLMYYMRMAMAAAKPSERKKMLEDWKTTVSIEGIARGVSNVFASGSWTNRPKRSRRAKAAEEGAPNQEAKAPRAKKVAKSEKA